MDRLPHLTGASPGLHLQDGRYVLPLSKKQEQLRRHGSPLLPAGRGTGVTSGFFHFWERSTTPRGMTGGVSATRAAGAWELAVPPAPIAGAAGGLPRRVPGGCGTAGGFCGGIRTGSSAGSAAFPRDAFRLPGAFPGAVTRSRWLYQEPQRTCDIGLGQVDADWGGEGDSQPSSTCANGPLRLRLTPGRVRALLSF